MAINSQRYYIMDDSPAPPIGDPPPIESVSRAVKIYKFRYITLQGRILGCIIGVIVLP